jgi:phosphoribosyl-ATP pyrophosphohydrolase/phosphoribosyl-AMP cyclohydrolase
MTTLRLDERGLVPAIIQDAATGRVLMLGWMSPGALQRTLAGGEVWLYSRSRHDLWHKGETSGTFLKVRRAWADCDGDALLFQVEPTGPHVCHTGRPSCFFTPVEALPPFERPPEGCGVLEDLFATIRDRQQAMPEGSGTARLLREGTARIAQKVIEEAGETALAAVGGQRDALLQEAADLLYHLWVLLAGAGLTPNDLWRTLRSRQR